MGRKLRMSLPIISAMTVFILFAVICRFNHIVLYSSGTERTLAWQDAFFQYLDFFSWLKDVLAGEQSIVYTFNCGLGQGGIGLFSYYLSSPFNLLIHFFDKIRLHEFFNLVLGLKIAFCGAAMAVFLENRYRSLSFWYAFLLSVSYGLMQYNFAQGSNLMWMDGVYMLPFILLGVYHFCKSGSVLLLSLSVALSVLLNWYTGGINCLAAAIYFCAEYFLGAVGEKEREERINIRSFEKAFARFTMSGCIGVMISAALFLPSIWALRQGKGGAFDWTALRPVFTGNPLSFISAYSIGELSAYGYPALFCGNAVLVGCLGLFALKTVSRKEKVIYLVLLAAALMIFYWQPLFMLFSLFKKAESYFYRYAYVSTALLIFAAGRFFSELSPSSADGVKLLKICGIFLLASLALNCMDPHPSPRVYSVSLLSAAVVALLCFAVSRNLHRRLCAAAMLGIWGLELLLNGHYVLRDYKLENADEFKQYNQNQLELVGTVKDQDHGTFRITQLMTRGMNDQGTTANLDESMAFDYMSVENYTSCPSMRQLDMLKRFGYAYHQDCLLEKNTFLLPVDSMLSVKYLLAPYQVRGMELTGPGEKKNGKQIFNNSYALPFAFSTDSLRGSQLLKKAGQSAGNIGNTGTGSGNTSAANPFEYWNQAYTALSGREAPFMERLEYRKERKNNQIVYTIQMPAGNYQLYGNIPTSSSIDASLDLNGVLHVPYSTWLAPQAVYVPVSADQAEATVILRAEGLDEKEPEIQEAQFYALNLDTFGNMTALLQERAAEEIEIRKDHVSIRKEGREGDILFTSIPYDEGWRITRNGQSVEPELFSDCLICLPLQDGENHFEFEYRIPWLRAGMAFTLLGIILLAGTELYHYRTSHI